MTVGMKFYIVGGKDLIKNSRYERRRVCALSQQSSSVPLTCLDLWKRDITPLTQHFSHYHVTVLHNLKKVETLKFGM
jgi:hypothetical protein